MTYLLHAMSDRAGEFIRLRRDIHRHPGLAFEEHRTAALAAAIQWRRGYSVPGCMVHNPGDDFHDGNIAVGSAFWFLLVERFLAAGEPATSH